MQISIQGAAAVFALLAAVFSYLSWITLVRTTEDEFEDRVRKRLSASYGSKDVTANIGLVSVRQIDNWKYKLERYTPFGEFDANCYLKVIVMAPDVYEILEDLPNENKVREDLSNESNNRLLSYHCESVESGKGQIMVSFVCNDPDVLFDDFSEVMGVVGKKAKVVKDESKL